MLHLYISYTNILTFLSFQAALLLKSQAQAVMNDDLDIDSDSDVVEIIGQSVTPEKYVHHSLYISLLFESKPISGLAAICF